MQSRLAAAGNGNPKRSAEELAAHVLGCKPLEIYFRELSPVQERELEALVVRAERGEPIQYIIGHVDFRGLEIRCDRRALIPRPETELLVEEVLRSKVEGQKTEVRGRMMEDGDRRSEVSNRNSEIGSGNQYLPPATRHSPLVIADVGCGTGCIGLALLAELPDAEVIAVDISPDALALARENAVRLGLAERFTAVQGDLLGRGQESGGNRQSAIGHRQWGCGEGQMADGGIVFFPERSFDLIVSNPPYVFSRVWENLEPCVRDFEPRLALDGGADGLDLIRPLVAQSARVLKPGGRLFLEIGCDQGQAVFQCLEKAGFRDVRIVKDLAGLDRIVHGRIG
jgi:release factor glutamine methyltransferase